MIYETMLLGCAVLWIIWHPASANVTSSPKVEYAQDYLKPFQEDFSIDAYVGFNISREHKPFDLKEVTALSRRYDFFRYRFAWKPYKSYGTTSLACYILSMTYQSAYLEILRYYHIRYLYAQTLEYEIGYLVYEVVWKYQMIVEIWSTVYRRYILQPHRWFTPHSYMLYMYSVIMEYSMAIIHLCNMLHELEKKYKDREMNIFDDDPSRTTDYFLRRSTVSARDRQRQLQKKRRKERRQRLIQMYEDGIFERTTPRRRLEKKLFPLHYGWSIEF